MNLNHVGRCGAFASLLYVAAIGNVRAQGIIPLSVRRDGATKSTGKSSDTRRAVVNFGLVKSVVDQLKMNGDDRRLLADEIIAQLGDYGKTIDSVAKRIRARGGADSASAQHFAQLLIGARSDTLENATKWLASTSAAGTSDRLYTNVEVFRYQSGSFSLRAVTALAVSDAAATTPSPQTTDDATSFRTGTKRLLAALQDGGPFAFHGLYEKEKIHSERRSSLFGLALTLAKSGTVDASGGPVLGIDSELRLVGHAPQSIENRDPESIALRLRVGYRNSSERIVSEIRTRNLTYLQLVGEGRPAGSKVPIGFAANLIYPKSLRPYAVSFQIFGTAGFGQ